jgi:hypothetical protein
MLNLDFVKQNTPKNFTPGVFYAQDSASVWLNDDESYAENLNEQIDIYLSLDGDQVVGFIIYNINNLISFIEEKYGHVFSSPVKLADVFHILAVGDQEYKPILDSIIKYTPDLEIKI